MGPLLVLLKSTDPSDMQILHEFAETNSRKRDSTESLIVRIRISKKM